MSNHTMYMYIYNVHVLADMHMYNVPYSRKYWRELNLAIGPQITIVKILADLNLAVQ